MEYNRTTLSPLDITRYVMESLSSSLETNDTIWRGYRHKDISKKVQMFLYKMLNNAYCIGDFWSQIPTYEHRAMCQLCRGENDSMEHILTHCTDPVKKTIWDLAKNIWPAKYGPWPIPHIGLILGCGTISLPKRPNEANTHNTNDNRPLSGASCLLHILISESAYLIWTMRCERTIRDTAHTEENTRKRWANVIDRRLQLNRAIASKMRQNTKTTTAVRNTWSDIINTNTQPLQQDWVTNLEVLVGIDLPRPLQTVTTR
ncbi:hypothetical protein CY34DRAFT_25139 [Suillus luteus UH-Slu-Lm8-n1]|uniref:Unplaced genomic scaffold CY34scaffold_200, whole genome shotgun sequence n=1 Tax=Suillus luteus UH-Slu-Lm8-n1 TaxID=930992 RepID=A0A0C9ZPU2_9AGAM|nr:hypothetical protein CY34DRAFT_25139 [Suillus luteus UH-Slu-Lm8-n1]